MFRPRPCGTVKNGGPQGSERGLAAIRRDAVGFVFQAFHLMEELTAVENVELPALLADRSPRAARRRATQLLDQVAMADRARHLPSELSGGLHQAGQTLVVATHDSRIAATADRMISMRYGAFVDETRLTGGTSGRLDDLVNLDG
jgi:predicted ABC-type transport system involved in lysophospholipase L1 biosynthesis ATPase subunit